MSALSPIFQGLSSGQFILQPDSQFSNNEYGWDIGKRTFLTHPSTPKSSWPKPGDRDTRLVSTGYALMYVVDVEPIYTDSTAIELQVSYKGITSAKPDKLLPGCDKQMFTIPVDLNINVGHVSGILFPLPMPKMSRIYITTKKPDFTGIGQTARKSFLKVNPIPAMTLPVTSSHTINWQNGWVLDDRESDDVASSIWMVTERFVYYYPMNLS